MQTALFIMYKQVLAAALLFNYLSVDATADERQFPSIGRAATVEEITAWDIAIGPNGEGLPLGSGNAIDGKQLYAIQCAYCHGESGAEGPDHRLVGGYDSLTGQRPILTIGSYWPYATTLFDYIRRAMPFLTPGSLSSDEIYALTAYLLFVNGIIDEQMSVNSENLAAIKMPNRDGFIDDPRPENFTKH